MKMASLPLCAANLGSSAADLISVVDVERSAMRCDDTETLEQSAWMRSKRRCDKIAKRLSRVTHRFDPVIPAELELVPVDEAVDVLVEHAEHLLDLSRLRHIDMSLVVAEQRATN